MLLSVVLTLSAGSVGDVPRSAMLLAANEQFAQSAPPMVPAPGSGVGAPNFGAKTPAAQLLYEIAALRRERPGIGGAVTLIGIGGGVGIAGAFYFLISGLAGGFSFANPLMVIGLVGLCVGLPMALIGTWLLIGKLNERARIGEEIHRLEGELKQVRARGLTSMGPPEFLPTAMTTLAQF